MALIVKNWPEFQHYKQRRPPWIKLHRQLLDDVIYRRLPTASRALAPDLWLLASEHSDGVIELSDADIAYRLRISDKELESGLKPLIEKGFMSRYQNASTTLACSEQDAMPEESRGETETKKSRDIKNYTPFKKPSLEEVASYCLSRGNGIDPEQFIAHYESNGWRVGKTPMKNWHFAVITWEKSRAKENGNGKSKLQNDLDRIVEGLDEAPTGTPESRASKV